MKKFYAYDGEHSPWKTTGPTKKILNALNDLIRINIDRVTAYEKASHDDTTPEPEFRELFYRLGTDSRAYVNTLHAEVIRLGGAPVTQSTITGKIYLYWLEGKHSFDGVDTASRLAACIEAESAVQKAYQQALDEQNQLPERIYQLVENQLWGVERAHQQLVSIHESHNSSSLVNNPPSS
jgi:uncharacterized protein (TIGR02284 family)